MDIAELLQKEVTFQDLIIMLRELQDKIDSDIAIDVFFNWTSDSTRKIVDLMHRT